ncbi:MAG: lipoprotein [Myxococcales bacterium]|nr:lipoprotein [Myxococcales bacterium]
MRRSLLALVGLLLVTGCSENTDELLPSATIGPEGGRVGRGLVVLDVPAGALDAPQLIAVFDVVDRSQLSFPGEAVSNFYRFEPQGLTLKTPATVSFGEVSAARPAIVWSTASDEDLLEAIESVMVDGRLVANVSHFSIGGVANQADATLDAGVTDTGPTDTGEVDTGALDAGPDDTGALDAGPDDTGAPLDAEPEDTGAPLDAEPEDTGAPLDAEPGDTGAVTITPAVLPLADACLTVTDPLQVQGGTAASWRVLDPAELGQWLPQSPYPGATVDSAGVLTRPPTYLLSGYQWSAGVEVTLTDGRTATQVWPFFSSGMGQYVVGVGNGPAIFTRPIPSIPAISQANINGWVPVQVAMPLSQHPCAGVRYTEDSSLCSGLVPGGFMGLDLQGVLQITDPSLLALVSPGTYCLGVNAEWGTMPVYLDSAVYAIDVTP